MQLIKQKEILTQSSKCFIFLEILGKKVRLKVSSKGIKTVEKKGGIDNYVITSKSSMLAPEIVKLKKLIESRKDNKD